MKRRDFLKVSATAVAAWWASRRLYVRTQTTRASAAPAPDNRTVLGVPMVIADSRHRHTAYLPVAKKAS